MATEVVVGYVKPLQTSTQVVVSTGLNLVFNMSDLQDVDGYSGQFNKYARVKTDGSGIEWVDVENQVFGRNVIQFANGATYNTYVDNGKTKYPFLRINGKNYLPTVRDGVAFTITSETITDNGDGTIIVATSGGNKTFSSFDAEAVQNSDYIRQEANLLAYTFIGARTDNTVGFVPSGSATAKSCWWENSINALIAPVDDLSHDTTEYDSEDFWRVLGTHTVLEDSGIAPGFGNWSTVAGQSIKEADRLKGYVYPDGSDNIYAVRDSVALPITRPATPIDDDRFYLASAVNETQLKMNALNVVDTFSDIVNYENPVTGQAVKTKGYYTPGDGGGNSYTFGVNGPIAINGSALFATPDVSGQKNILQFGHNGGTSITASLTSAVSSGCKDIIISQKICSLSQKVDLNGGTITGVNTFINGSRVINGQINDIEFTQYPFRDPSNSTIAIGKTKQKLIYREANPPQGLTSSNNEIYTIISPSSCGGISRFTFVNGNGASGANDRGAPFDRLRPVQSYLYKEGFAIKATTSNKSSGVVTSSETLAANVYQGFGGYTNFQYSSDGIEDVFANQIPSGGNDWVEFEIYGVTSEAFVTCLATGGSSTDVEIKVNGSVQKSGNYVQSTSKTVRNVAVWLDVGSVNTIRVTNLASAGFVYVFGMNFFNLCALPASRRGIGEFFDKVVCYDGGIATTTNGACYDTVFVDGDGKYCGSYHGGDTASLCQLNLGGHYKSVYDIKTSTNSAPTNPFPSIMLMSDSISVQYQGEVTTTGRVGISLTYDLGVDGGIQTRGVYTLYDNVTFKALYTGMVTADRTLAIMPVNSFDPGTPTNTNTSYPLGLTPFTMASSDDKHIAICPKVFSNDYSDVGQYIWDTANYIKYYYMPIAGCDVSISAGEHFNFDCLYQLGANL